MKRAEEYSIVAPSEKLEDAGYESDFCANRRGLIRGWCCCCGRKMPKQGKKHKLFSRKKKNAEEKQKNRDLISHDNLQLEDDDSSSIAPSDDRIEDHQSDSDLSVESEEKRSFQEPISISQREDCDVSVKDEKESQDTFDQFTPISPNSVSYTFEDEVQTVNTGDNTTHNIYHTTNTSYYYSENAQNDFNPESTNEGNIVETNPIPTTRVEVERLHDLDESSETSFCEPDLVSDQAPTSAGSTYPRVTMRRKEENRTNSEPPSSSFFQGVINMFYRHSQHLTPSEHSVHDNNLLQ